MTARKEYILFDRDTQAVVYGMQQDAIQRMLDFDYICRREKPSVAAIVNPTRDGWHKCFYGSEEMLIPMYRTLNQVVEKHPNTDVMVNFASFRSAYPTTKEALETETLRTIAVIAEGIPEQYCPGAGNPGKEEREMDHRSGHGGRYCRGRLQNRKHGRRARQYHRVPALSARARCLCYQIGRSFQRAQQHHCPEHRRRAMKGLPSAAIATPEAPSSITSCGMRRIPRSR